MKYRWALVFAFFTILYPIYGQDSLITDSSGNIVLLQRGEHLPTLFYLCCTGGRMMNIDTSRFVADSLGWNIAVCAGSKNHRDPALNERDILDFVSELYRYPEIDPHRIILYGFSGQGAQALGTALKFPTVFGGVITQCAHHGLIKNPNWRGAKGLPIVLVTRKKDWNRESNEQMAELFEKQGLKVKLITTQGEHHIGDAKELYRDCKIMHNMLRKKR